MTPPPRIYVYMCINISIYSYITDSIDSNNCICTYTSQHAQSDMHAICAWACQCMRPCMSICPCKCEHVRTCACECIECTSIWMCICLAVRMHTHVYMCTRTSIHLCQILKLKGVWHDKMRSVEAILNPSFLKVVYEQTHDLSHHSGAPEIEGFAIRHHHRNLQHNLGCICITPSSHAEQGWTWWSTTKTIKVPHKHQI